MSTDKYAILDADFISKAHQIRKDDSNRLIDRILEMKGYRFYCHEQIRKELERDEIGDSFAWLNKRITDGSISCITDKTILDELRIVYSNSAPAMYMNMLQKACDAFKNGLFKEKFIHLQSIDYSSITNDGFLSELEIDCKTITENLGELKCYVLLQSLSVIKGTSVYVFCSDDKNARRGIVTLGGVRCISLISSFIRLNDTCVLSKDDAEPYINSLITYLSKHSQTTIKVCDSTKNMNMIKVPCKQLFDELYEGKIEALQTGVIRYKELKVLP